MKGTHRSESREQERISSRNQQNGKLFPELAINLYRRLVVFVEVKQKVE